MRRSVTIIVVCGGLVVAGLWFALHDRQTSVPQATIAYAPERVRGVSGSRPPPAPDDDLLKAAASARQQ